MPCTCYLISTYLLLPHVPGELDYLQLVCHYKINGTLWWQTRIYFAFRSFMCMFLLGWPDFFLSKVFCPFRQWEINTHLRKFCILNIRNKSVLNNWKLDKDILKWNQFHLHWIYLIWAKDNVPTDNAVHYFQRFGENNYIYHTDVAPFWFLYNLEESNINNVVAL